MHQAAVLYVPAGSHVPAEYTAGDTVRVPAIRPEAVVDASRDLIDVTSVEDTDRRFIPGMTTLRTKDGARYTASDDVITLALNGGGTFTVAHLNPIAGPETREQWEENESIREAYEAMEASEYHDYTDDEEVTGP